MTRFDVRYFGASLIDQRYCFELLKWVVMEMRRANLGSSLPATLEINKQCVQFRVQGSQSTDALPDESRIGSVAANQSAKLATNVRLADSSSEYRTVNDPSAVQQVQTEFSRVHRFVQLNAAKCEFCYLVKPNVANGKSTKQAQQDTAASSITCYVFEAESTADLSAIADAFNEARRCASEPSREGARVDNIDTLMQVGCSFFEVAYVGRVGSATQAVPLDRVDPLIASLVQRRKLSFSELLPEPRPAKTDGERQQPASTMLLEIADSFVCLINTVTKCVMLSREIRHTSYVFQGHSEQQSHYIGLVARETRALAAPAEGASPPPPFYVYVLECSEKAVADECMYTLRQAFETTRNRNPDAYRCPECPVALLNSIVQRVDKLLVAHFQLDGTAQLQPAAELTAAAVQSQLATLIDDVSWWPSFDVHRLSALVQEAGAPLLSTQSGTNLTLFASLQTALRTASAISSLSDALLALKTVLDVAQREHTHISANDPVLREGFLARPGPTHDAKTQPTTKAPRTPTHSNGDQPEQQRGGVLRLLDRLKIFSKDGSTHSPPNDGSRLRVQSMHSPSSSSPSHDTTRATDQLATVTQSTPDDAARDESQPTIKLPALAIVTEENRSRAHSESAATLSSNSTETSTGTFVVTTDATQPDATTSVDPTRTVPADVSQCSSERDIRNGQPQPIDQSADTQSASLMVNETMQMRRGSYQLQPQSPAISTPRTNRSNRRTSMPPRARLQMAEDSPTLPSVRYTIFQRVVNPGFVAPRVTERDDVQLDGLLAGSASDSNRHDANGQTDSSSSGLYDSAENRTARDRWRKAIWNAIIKRRSDKQDERQRSIDDRLSYDDVAQTTTAYAAWKAVLASPNEQRSLKELRRLVKAGVPKALRGRIWLYLIEQQKARRACEPDSNEASESEQEEETGEGNSNSASGQPAKTRQNNTKRRTRAQTLKSALLEKDNLSDLNSIGSNSLRFAPTSFEESVRLFEEQLGRLTTRDAQRAIMIDLGRTFPQYPYFSSGQGVGQLSLFNLLKAYSLLDPEVGYCQGLGFIVGVLLLHLSENEAFYALCYFMNDMNFREQYLPNMLGLQIQEYQLEHLLVDEDPALHSHLAQHGVAPSLYASSWFLTLFAANFPIGVVARIFDFLFCDGSIEIVLRTALLLLTEHSELLTSFHSLETIVDCFKATLPKIAPLQIDRIIAKLYDRSFAKRMHDYELEFCVTQETQNEMRSRVTELENELERFRRLLQRAERFLSADREAQSLRTQIREALNRNALC